MAAMPVWLKEKLFLKDLLQKELRAWTGRIRKSLAADPVLRAS